MERKQFTFYRSFWEAIENLQTNKEKLQAYQLLCGYALNQTEPELRSVKPSAATVYQLARPILDRAHERAKKMLTVAGCEQSTEEQPAQQGGEQE